MVLFHRDAWMNGKHCRQALDLKMTLSNSNWSERYPCNSTYATHLDHWYCPVKMENVFAINRGGATLRKLDERTITVLSEPERSVFPITRAELPQFAKMSALMFLFIYVFTTVRDTKDTLIVSHCGAEAIPFLKLYGVMPCAMVFIVGYSRLSNFLESKSALFYCTLIPFFAFYAAFAFILYPMRGALHSLPTGSQEKGLGAITGVGGAAVSLLRYWTFSLYFIVSELWASAGVPLLFWQCANEVTTLTEAKRFYPLFAVFGNLGPIASGIIMSAVVSRQKNSSDVDFGGTLKALAAIKTLVCIGICFLYHSINITASKRANTVSIDKKSTISGKKPSLGQSLRELANKKELRSMATMVICYNVCVELTEVVWKGLLRTAYTNPSTYMTFMAGFSKTVGISAFVLQLFASHIIRELGWKRSAMLTPIWMGILAIPFLGSVAAGTARVQLATAVAIGTIQNIVSKITKYSLFDPCKEMAYIPLGSEAKLKGKAAVDVVGARMGRSIGSAAQQFMVFVAGGTILKCAPALGFMYVFFVALWIAAVIRLDELFVQEWDGEEHHLTSSSAKMK